MEKEKAVVYFTDFRCKVGTSQLDKLRKLCIAAGIKNQKWRKAYEINNIRNRKCNGK